MSNIILIVGYQASGKSTLSQTLINQGYIHINRDKEGGSIAGLVPLVEAAIKSGKNVVLDNTFPTKAGRKMFIELARKHKASITCYWLNTSIEDAQFNACTRLIKMFGSLPSNNDIKKSKHPNVFPPAALFGYRKEFEKPTTQEGFDVAIVPVPTVSKKKKTAKQPKTPNAPMTFSINIESGDTKFGTSNVSIDKIRKIVDILIG